ncbi:MAG: hypothetical protein H7838_14085, partial [Magnetococcus sp. DMHC-8]
MSHTVESATPSGGPAASSAALRVRLRIFLPIIFSLLISMVALLIIFITNRSATHSIQALAEEVMTRVSQRVVDKTSYYLDSAAHVVQMNATMWQRDSQGPEVRFSQRLAMSGRLGLRRSGKGATGKPVDRSERRDSAGRLPDMAGEGPEFLAGFHRTTHGQFQLGTHGRIGSRHHRIGQATHMVQTHRIALLLGA